MLTVIATLCLMILGVLSPLYAKAQQPQGRLVVWGTETNVISHTPVHLSNVVAIAASGLECAAVLSTGEIVGWGWMPCSTNIHGVKGQVLGIAVTDGYGVALLEGGRLASWHRNFTQVNTPEIVKGAIAVCVAPEWSYVLGSDGHVFDWPCKPERYIPRYPGLPPPGLSNVVQIRTGHYHCLALRQDGRVVAWGGCRRNFRYTGNRDCPVPAEVTNIVSIAASTLSMALNKDGRIFVWDVGEFDDLFSKVPSGAGKARAIAAGDTACFAIKEDGGVVGWGLVREHIPEGLSNVIAIEAGAGFALAIVP